MMWLFAAKALKPAARFSAQAAIAGVYAGAQSLLLCDPAQQNVELLALGHAERSADGVIVFTCDPPNLFCDVSARHGQMQRIRPPICCILTTFDETSFLEFIQQGNQLAWQNGQAAGQLLLAESRGQCDQPKNARVRAG